MFNSGLPNNSVYSIAFEETGTTWIGTGGGGLVKFDGRNWEVFDHSNSELPKDFVYTVTVDSDNIKWVGTWKGGIIRFK